MSSPTIKRALISVSDKLGLADFARGLVMPESISTVPVEHAVIWKPRKSRFTISAATRAFPK